MSKKIIQTAGRTQLGDFAPTFAHLNDDVLGLNVKRFAHALLNFSFGCLQRGQRQSSGRSSNATSSCSAGSYT